MSMKKLLAVLIAALMIAGLAVPNEALCVVGLYGLYSQEITLLQALETVKELEIKSADKAGDTERSEKLRKELQEIQRKIDRLKKFEKEFEKELKENPKPIYDGLG